MLNRPVGVAGTDHFLMDRRLTGKPIPAALEKERGQLVDAMADSQAHLHGKKFALYGDPDQMLGLAAFLLELGAEPTHVLATNGGKDWAEKMQALFDSSPFGKDCKVYPEGPVAPALAAVHRAGGLPDRQHLRQVPGARHRHAADPHGLPDLRPPPLPPLPDLGLRGRA